MKKGQPPQPFGGAGKLLDLSTCVPHKRIEGRVDGCHQDLVFVLEVEIDGAVSDVGAIGDVGDSRVEKAFVGEYRDRSLEDALVFFSIAVCAYAAVPRSRQRSLRVSLHQGPMRGGGCNWPNTPRNPTIHPRMASCDFAE